MEPNNYAYLLILIILDSALLYASFECIYILNHADTYIRYNKDSVKILQIVIKLFLIYYKLKETRLLIIEY